jgi:WD40 repeat protein
LASCGADRTVRFWKLDGTPGLVVGGLPGEPWRLAWGREGRLAVLGSNGLLTVWTVGERSCRALWSGLSVAGRAVTFGPDGRLLLGDEKWSEEHLVHIVGTETGSQVPLRPSRFRRETHREQP